MEINEEKTVDMLSTESVSILTRKVLIDGEDEISSWRES